MHTKSRSRHEREQEDPSQGQANGQAGDQQDPRNEPPEASCISQLTKESLRLMIDVASVGAANQAVTH